MLAIIADDFTGAAELAGISLRYGLTVELFVGEIAESNADVVVISTDSRSQQKEKALEVTQNILKQVLQLKPSLIYKKIDSVLRGYVLDELGIQMKLMNNNMSAFIMPANPSLNRTISNGKYFINGIEINKTGFANDPEFPNQTSVVKEILNDKVQVVKPGGNLQGQIIVGEVESFDDYKYWVDHSEGKVLAGAGDFYSALLDKMYQPVSLAKAELRQPFLYVCGTSFGERKNFIRSLNFVSWMPEIANKDWVKQAVEKINQYKKVVIAIDKSDSSPTVLRDAMSEVAKEIIEQAKVKEVLIEGGSTATAVLKKMGIKRFSLINELSRGVVRMKAGQLFISVKPGSYQLPEEIMKLLTES